MNIPKSAKKVFKGVMFDIYHWDQELFDGSTAVYEAARRKNTVLTIPTQNNKILLSFEEQPTYPAHLRLFGGRIEEGEYPLEAAQRELKEEIGYTSDDWVLYKTYDPEAIVHWNVSIFIARNAQKTHTPTPEPGEKIEIKSVSIDEFLHVMSEKQRSLTHFSYDMHMMSHDEHTYQSFYSLLFPSL